MELRAKHDPAVRKKMTSQRNVTYLGHAAQNEIMDCLAEMGLSSIISEVTQSEPFSIMVDVEVDFFFFPIALCFCFWYQKWPEVQRENI